MSVNDISAEIPDWSREVATHFWSPGPKLLQSIRAVQHWDKSSLVYAKVMKKLATIRYRFWSVVSGAEIPVETKIGGGLLIPHPNGIVINSDAEIGVNCLIHQQVTIGVTRGNPIPPKIGGHVDISAGAVVVGNITVGDHALIGANAVVTKDVPAYEISGGVPAKKIGSTDTEIGANCLIHQQVAIGVKRGNPISPKIGGHVDISADAVIVGDSTVGDHALIGANAVATKDAPANEISSGVPAKKFGLTNK